MVFIDLWNIYRIYKPQTCLNSIFGQPKLNYFYPKNGPQEYFLLPPTQLFATMENNLAEWDISFFFWIN